MNNIKKLSDLAAYLRVVAKTFSQKDYEELYQTLRARYDQQVMEAFMERHPGWSIVQGNAACLMFLYRNWAFSRKASENAGQLIALADNITQNYEECDEQFLTEAVVTEVMKIVDRVYDFSNYVLKNQHTFVFLFQAKRRTEDSFCRCFATQDGAICADVYMLIPQKDKTATPQSILLHELGHCVNIALTGDPEASPEDFALVLKLLGIDETDCDVPEFFAHCFAMSLLIEPELLNTDPFRMVLQNHKRMFRTYFEYKINRP